MYKVKNIKIGDTNVKCVYDENKQNIEEKLKEILTKYVENIGEISEK